MPLNAADSSYGPLPGAAGLSSGEEASETTPLLPSEPAYTWRPLNQKELQAAAGGPGWSRLRWSLVLLFWLAWLATLAVAVAIVVVSPRPTPTSVGWWQRCLFYRLRPAELDTDAGAERSEVINAAWERFPYLRSVGIGAVILEGAFHKKASPDNFTASDVNLEALAQIQHLLIESNKADLRLVLDFCKVNLLELHEEMGNLDKFSKHPAAEKRALRFWLEQGVAGFVICDTDAAYSVETLLEWRGVLEEFSSKDNERILVVKQTTDVLRPLNISTYGNITLVNVVMRSILPKSHHLLSATEVAQVLETRLQPKLDDVWPSWNVGGAASPDLKQLLLVLMMTLPGSPAFQYKEETNQTQDEETKRPAVALFTTLSRSKAREEALLYGSFTFLPFNTTSYVSPNSSSSSAPPPPILAFLRSWGCVHFLVLLNFGAEPLSLDPAWAPGLPEKGVFVASTGMNHLGVTSLYSITLQPHEAIVIKLFKA
ncbi:4F2 cell-surface antigen heavy chain [Kryptolebias marmoratus]|uniref:Si:dkey-202g17.3 n=1 Tax=Kryptolebias marmoratus TaxID=37003 RepID=A0A3Q3BFK8_KRYMA|nr:4F2 cell-surface antigen heavy chain [Kryptolebias marmoratus]